MMRRCFDWRQPLVQDALRNRLAPSDVPKPPKPGRDAAVLIPLCTFTSPPSTTSSEPSTTSQPGILFTVRSHSLRSHVGEVSFPGGIHEATDASLLETALRETSEELNIAPESISILGFAKPYALDLTGRKVWPFVGYLGEYPLTPAGDVQISWSSDEVDTVFGMTMDEVMSPKRQKVEQFRALRLKYLTWQGPKRKDLDKITTEAFHLKNSVLVDNEWCYRIWGLSGYILTRMLRNVFEPMLHDNNEQHEL